MLEELAELKGEEYDKKEQEMLSFLWRNSIVSDTYMPGSTFKIITVACGFMNKKINKNYSEGIYTG